MATGNLAKDMLKTEDAFIVDNETEIFVWVGKGAHLPSVPADSATLLVVDVRCLEKPTSASSLKPQGWGVLPVFVDGVVDSGLHQVPLFVGSPSLPVLDALSKVAHLPVDGWQKALGKVLREFSLGIIDQASVTVTLLDAQRFGELDTPEALAATPERSRLPTGYVQTYIKDVPQSKPLSSLVGKVKAAKDKGGGGGGGKTGGGSSSSASPPRRRGFLGGGAEAAAGQTRASVRDTKF